MKYLMIIPLILLTDLIEESIAATVFLHGTEHCGVARDSSELLLSRGSEPHISFIRKDCVELPPGSLPNRAMPDNSLLTDARNCRELIGQEQWSVFEEKWNRAYRSHRGSNIPGITESHIVGAYCRSIKEAKQKNSDTVTILNFGHGSVKRSPSVISQPASIKEKKGNFEFGTVTYPADILWALDSLIPKEMRVVKLFENCFGELIMNNADLGPDQNFDDYRVNSCSMAAAPHDQVLTLSLSGRSKYRVINNRCHVFLANVTSARTDSNSNTFMRNFINFESDLKKPLTIDSFDKWVNESNRLSWNKVDKENSRNRSFGVPVDYSGYMPVTGSMSLLNLYYEKRGLPKVSKQRDICEVCQKRSQIQISLDEQKKVLLNQITNGLHEKIKKIHSEIFPQENEINLLKIKGWVLEQEDEDNEPAGSLNQAYIDYNAVKVEVDKRSEDYEKICGHLRTPPSCNRLSKTCTLKDIVPKCKNQDELKSVYYKNVCGKIITNDNLELNRKLIVFADEKTSEKGCLKNDISCFTENSLSEYKQKKYKEFKKKELRVMKAKVLIRMTQSYFGLDAMLSDFKSEQEAIKKEALRAFETYNNMIQCENKEIFK